MSTAIETPIQSVYLPSFIESTKAIFKTMLGLELNVQGTDRLDNLRPGHDVTGIIGFAGTVE